MRSFLAFTDDRFVVSGKSYPDTPLLISENGLFVEPVCAYFRQLRTVHQLAATSIKTYAEHISTFWNFLDSQNIDMHDFCDHNLRSWLNLQEKNGVSSSTRADRCDVIFTLYVWFESNGYVKNVVRIPTLNDRHHFEPQLSSKQVVHRRFCKARGRSYGLVSPLRPRHQEKRLQHTPTTEEISRISIAADNPHNSDLADRNHCLISWYSQVGLRRKEFRSLCVSQIPEWEEIARLQDATAACEVLLTKTKGSKKRFVAVLPDLLEHTREYIEGARSAIISRFQAKYGSQYRTPSEVFLSNKTGLPLTLIGISNLLTSWFKSSGVDGHGHRLRATYLTNLFHAEIDAEEQKMALHPEYKRQIDFEMVLRKVAERAGHSCIESLRPYLVFVRKQRARKISGLDEIGQQQMIAARQQELAILEARLSRLRTEIQSIKLSGH